MSECACVCACACLRWSLRKQASVIHPAVQPNSRHAIPFRRSVLFRPGSRSGASPFGSSYPPTSRDGNPTFRLSGINFSGSFPFDSLSVHTYEYTYIIYTYIYIYIYLFIYLFICLCMLIYLVICMFPLGGKCYNMTSFLVVS